MKLSLIYIAGDNQNTERVFKIFFPLEVLRSTFVLMPDSNLKLNFCGSIPQRRRGECSQSAQKGPASKKRKISARVPESDSESTQSPLTEPEPESPPVEPDGDLFGPQNLHTSRNSFIDIKNEVNDTLEIETIEQENIPPLQQVDPPESPGSEMDIETPNPETSTPDPEAESEEELTLAENRDRIRNESGRSLKIPSPGVSVRVL